MGYIIAMMLAALGGLIFINKRSSNAETLKENDDANKKVADFQAFIDKQKQALVDEQQKRDQAAADLKAKENASVTQEDLLKFLNDKPSDDNK